MNGLDKQLFRELVNRDWGVTALALAMGGLILSATVGIPLAATLISALVAFTAFDVIGYNAVATSNERMNLVRYRVLQVHYQWILFTTVGLITDWNLWASIGFLLLHWIGVCDVLFYVLLRRERDLISYGNMPWLWWTPLGIINNYLGVRTSGRVVWNVAVWSTITWFGLLLFFPELHHQSLSWFSFLLPF